MSPALFNHFENPDAGIFQMGMCRRETCAIPLLTLILDRLDLHLSESPRPVQTLARFSPKYWSDVSPLAFPFCIH
jgi:hypothetical protein